MALLGAACSSGGSSGSNSGDNPSANRSRDQEFLDAFLQYSRLLATDNRKFTSLGLSEDDAIKREQCRARVIYDAIGRVTGAEELNLTPEGILRGDVRSWFGETQLLEQRISLPYKTVQEIEANFSNNCQLTSFDPQVEFNSALRFLFPEAYAPGGPDCMPELSQKLSFYENFAVEPTIELSAELETIAQSLESCFSLSENTVPDLKAKYSWVGWGVCAKADEALELYLNYREDLLGEYISSIRDYGKNLEPAPDERAGSTRRVTQVTQAISELSRNCIDAAALAEARGADLALVERNIQRCLTDEVLGFASILTLLGSFEDNLISIAALLEGASCSTILERLLADSSQS